MHTIGEGHPLAGGPLSLRFSGAGGGGGHFTFLDFVPHVFVQGSRV